MHAPVNVITVEREYGSHGAEFAHDLAARLGWRLLDSELVDEAARAAGVDPKLAAKFDERLDPWYYRYGKIFWQEPMYVTSTGGEHMFDSDRMVELIRQGILKAAHAGRLATRAASAMHLLRGLARKARGGGMGHEPA